VVLDVLVFRYVCALTCANAVGDYWCVVGVKQSQPESFEVFIIVSSSIGASAESGLQYGRQHNSHPNEPYFSDFSPLKYGSPRVAVASVV